MFNKKTADDVLKLFEQLSEEEKAKVMTSIKKPDTTDEKQIAKAEKDMEAKGEENGTKDQSAKDILDESVGEQEHLDGNKDSQSAKDRVDESVGAEAADMSKAEDKQTKDNEAKAAEMLAERVSALEEKLKGFDELKARMDEYTAKQAEKFGYKGKPFGERKSMEDMTADELKQTILSGN